MSNFYPIANTLSYFPSINKSDHTQSTIILCDFDGTISLEDVTDILLEKFADKKYQTIEEQWLAGEIGSKECMSQQIALLHASKQEIDAALAQIEIDTSFHQFVQTAIEHHIPLHVLSDGLDYAIKSVLQRNNLLLPVFANQLLYNNDRGWKIEFPYNQPDCVKASGNCKCRHVYDQYKHFDNIIYVGDGASDYCVSDKVDVVFAKSKLINYCQEKQINYLAINDFSDAIHFLLKALK